jgi:hypothetical protein
MRHTKKIESAVRLAIGVLPLAAALSLLAGCGGPKEPPRYNLSGKVTYRGAAVPHATIFFLPDRARGNNGPQFSVAIIDGAYKTLPGRGPTAGPYQAIITGLDPSGAQNAGPRNMPPPKPLFPQFQVSIDLPKQDSTHDFVVPAPEE